MAVNFSAQQMCRPDFAGGVLRALERTGLPAALLEIEVTEQSLIRNLPSAAAQLAQLAGRSVRVAICHFGTGYSSPSHLARLPIHTLKIDRSFVQDLDGGGSILKAIIAMSGELGLATIAKGVETPAQLDALRRSGRGLRFRNDAERRGQGRCGDTGIPLETRENAMNLILHNTTAGAAGLTTVTRAAALAGAVLALAALQGCARGEAAPPLSKPLAKDAYCSQTADAVADACEAATVEAFLIAQANCANLDDADARAECLDEADVANEEEQEACEEQEAARLDACALLGESRYDPAVDPANFVDPLQIGDTVAPNAYLPLVPGYTRVYEKGDETITVTVTHDTVQIMGVTCIVVRDIAEENGELVEETDDWFAQDLAGNVWYFGEFVRNFEGGLLHDLDGSFKAGEDGAKPGIAMQAAPQVGEVYRQEWFLNEAEDIAEVLGTAASESAPAARCDGTCLQTRDFSPLEPDTSEHKFYVPGIGEIVAYHVDEPGEREELVEYYFE